MWLLNAYTLKAKFLESKEKHLFIDFNESWDYNLAASLVNKMLAGGSFMNLPPSLQRLTEELGQSNFLLNPARTYQKWNWLLVDFN